MVLAVSRITYNVLRKTCGTYMENSCYEHLSNKESFTFKA